MYPSGHSWLERRLDDVERNEALCSLAGLGDCLGGILIETPKGRRASKISTLYVHEALSGFGLGASLFARHRQRWLELGIDRVHITVPSIKVSQMEGFLLRRRFQFVTSLSERYGPDRSEMVFSTLTH
jgi:hypothetical protein